MTARPDPRTAVARLFLDGRFLRFAIVGAGGFLVDAAGLMVLTAKFGMDALTARAISFSIAVAATWLANRIWGFRTAGVNRALPELTRYLAVQLSGGAVNLAVYTVALLLLPASAWADTWGPLAALVPGSAAGLMFTYVGARFFAFAVPRFQPGP